MLWADVPPTAVPTSEALAVGGASEPLPEQADAPLSPSDMLRYKPNELGSIPIIMYHVITLDPTLEGEMYRTVDEFKADLQWLYNNDFYVISMNELLSHQIDVPAGKHPVVLTFDDGSVMQFGFIEGKNGKLTPDPHSAVGILEGFYAKHPDFGRGGHFAIQVGNQFSWPNWEQEHLFEEKIDFMIENGYEIGNHTETHHDLMYADVPTMMYEIGEPTLWANERLGESSTNAMNVLTLPFGAYPHPEANPDGHALLRTGFDYEGQPIPIDGVLLVCCTAAPSPASSAWNPMAIPRMAGDEIELGYFQDQVAAGEVTPYTSDGEPSFITVPSEQAYDLVESTIVNVGEGQRVIVYDTGTGRVIDDAQAVVAQRRGDVATPVRFRV